MSLTLVEASKLALANGEVLRSTVIEMFARASDILRVLPFTDIAGNAYKYNRESALPGIAFRGVNEAYAESTGVINPLVEALTICGGDLDVDMFILKTQGMNVRSTHEYMKIKALAAEWVRVFLKGDQGANPREFDGMQKRITGSQLIDNAAGVAGGAFLSLQQLDAAIDQTTGASAILMSKAVRRLLQSAARNYTVAGYITYQADEFGRRIVAYNDLPIIVPYSDNGGVEPIAFDEVAAGGGGAVCTSLYVMGLGDGLMHGIQNGGMDVRDMGELQANPVMRTRTEWYAGLCVEHGRSVTRLSGIKTGAVVA